jgi:sulfite exporter TauE/SafE
MLPLLIAVLSASLLGSLHCAGMCGPFCAIAVSGKSQGVSAAALHTAYHGGRLVTYLALGVVAGFAGAMVDLASTLAGVEPIALALAGGTMVLFGVAELAKQSRWAGPVAQRLRFPLPAAWVLGMQRGQRWAAGRSPLARAAVIGLLTTLLPCGWLYAFVVTAAGTASPWRGALVMAVFWVGTLPVLVALGSGVRGATGWLGRRLPVVTAGALVLVGLTTLTGRASLSPSELVAGAIASAPSATAAPDPHELPPCCRPQAATSEPLP